MIVRKKKRIQKLNNGADNANSKKEKSNEDTTIKIEHKRIKEQEKPLSLDEMIMFDEIFDD